MLTSEASKVNGLFGVMRQPLQYHSKAENITSAEAEQCLLNLNDQNNIYKAMDYYSNYSFNVDISYLEPLLGLVFSLELSKNPNSLELIQLFELSFSNNNLLLHIEENGYFDYIISNLDDLCAVALFSIMIQHSERFRAMIFEKGIIRILEEQLSDKDLFIISVVAFCCLSICYEKYHVVFGTYKKLVDIMMTFSDESVTICLLENLHAFCSYSEEFSLYVLNHHQFVEFLDSISEKSCMQFCRFITICFSRDYNYRKTTKFEGEECTQDNFVADFVYSGIRNDTFQALLKKIIELLLLGLNEETSEYSMLTLSTICIKSEVFIISYENHLFEYLFKLFEGDSSFRLKSVALKCLCSIFMLASEEEALYLIQSGLFIVIGDVFELMLMSNGISIVDTLTSCMRLHETTQNPTFFKAVFENNSIVEMLNYLESANIKLNDDYEIPISLLVKNILCREEY